MGSHKPSFGMHIFLLFFKSKFLQISRNENGRCKKSGTTRVIFGRASLRRKACSINTPRIGLVHFRAGSFLVVVVVELSELVPENCKSTNTVNQLYISYSEFQIISKNLVLKRIRKGYWNFPTWSLQQSVTLCFFVLYVINFIFILLFFRGG